MGGSAQRDPSGTRPGCPIGVRLWGLRASVSRAHARDPCAVERGPRRPVRPVRPARSDPKLPLRARRMRRRAARRGTHRRRGLEASAFRWGCGGAADHLTQAASSCGQRRGVNTPMPGDRSNCGRPSRRREPVVDVKPVLRRGGAGAGVRPRRAGRVRTRRRTRPHERDRAGRASPGRFARASSRWPR